jgi:hypothetical protein
MSCAFIILCFIIFEETPIINVLITDWMGKNYEKYHFR